jgi:MtN3 and saliva related transmembrane protein
MTPVAIEVVGSIAAVLTTICWVLQALRPLRTRATKAISAWTQAIFAIGLVLWLIYGSFLGSWPLIAANAVSLVLVLSILVLKLRFG